MRSTVEVLDHHLKYFANGDIDGVLSDYSADAVFFWSEGVLHGPGAIKPVFERMFVELAKPGASVARKQRLIEGEYAYIAWTAETADNSYELARTLWLFRTEAFECKLLRQKSSRSTQ
jgi:ketosteroid isomerase-like protein